MQKESRYEAPCPVSSNPSPAPLTATRAASLPTGLHKQTRSYVSADMSFAEDPLIDDLDNINLT